MATILVIDDDPNNRLLLKSILSYDQHKVLEATNGAEGLDSVERHSPDLVIVDLNMPGIDGVTFVKTIRSKAALDHLEIALYTGTTMTSAIEDFLELYRVNTVIIKPSEPQDVLRLVRAALLRP
ncbi:MAG TPA: response regulator [Candidatus Acidoferrales bacterium]|nr:response regulator [Candidatus Acidoferrales bacterium]